MAPTLVLRQQCTLYVVLRMFALREHPIFNIQTNQIFWILFYGFLKNLDRATKYCKTLLCWWLTIIYRIINDDKIYIFILKQKQPSTHLYEIKLKTKDNNETICMYEK
jgi:hypothetical protein